MDRWRCWRGPGHRSSSRSRASSSRWCSWWHLRRPPGRSAITARDMLAQMATTAGRTGDLAIREIAKYPNCSRRFRRVSPRPDVLSGSVRRERRSSAGGIRVPRLFPAALGCLPFAYVLVGLIASPPSARCGSVLAAEVLLESRREETSLRTGDAVRGFRLARRCHSLAISPGQVRDPTPHRLVTPLRAWWTTGMMMRGELQDEASPIRQLRRAWRLNRQIP
jgi:hypothetical protein